MATMALLLLAPQALRPVQRGPELLKARVDLRPPIFRAPRLVLSESPMQDSPQSEAERQAVNAKFESDLAAFRAQKPQKEAAFGSAEETLLQKTVNILGKILTFNFFIICIFFIWFLAGIFAQFGLQQTDVINSFRGAWDVIILPLLSTHMALTFLSAGLEKLSS